MSLKKLTKDSSIRRRPSKEYPELVELAVDVANFTKKWTPPRLAKALGIRKQSLYPKMAKQKGQNETL